MNENFKQQILRKISELNRNPSENLAIVHEIVRELRAHVEGLRKIEELRIESLVSRLTAYTLGIPVSIPLSSNTLFTRGVKYSEDDGGVFYRKTSRLSYIPSEFAHKTRQNRLNKAGESIFYASLDTQNASITTVLAEIEASKGDVINLLYSVTRSDQSGALHVIPIGIMDYFRCGIPVPFNLHPTFKEMYELLRKFTNPIAMEAIHLCDEFMNAMLTAKAGDKRDEEGSGLYDITCALAKDFLAAPQIDGILYQSTKSTSFPNVALRPASVDEKLHYAAAAAYSIVDRLGEAQFTLRCLGNGVVKGDQIVWII
jgi:hypothetical protein